MDIFYYYMDGCPHCVEMTPNVEKSGIPISKKIEKGDVSNADKTKYGVKSYPTIIFAHPSGKLISKLEGIHSVQTIKTAYNTAKTSIDILNKFRDED